MNQYLVDTEFAMKNLFDLVTHENKQITSLKAEMKVHQDRANKIMSDAYYVTDQDVDDLETPGMHAIRHGYVRHLNAANAVRDQIVKLTASFQAKDFSVQALCGSVLQIAKQGISIVHGKNAPYGITEPLSGEFVYNIILQGRNQSMHYEEGKYRAPVVSCFQNLQQAFGSDLDITTGGNKAKYIVFHVLGWRTYNNYLGTMTQLLP